MSNTIKIIYTIFIGVLLATFVGVGIAAFYPEPKYPEYPPELNYRFGKEPTQQESAQMYEEQQQYDKTLKEYQEETNVYNRNVSIIALSASILILIVSLTFVKNILLIADGLMIGGILTLIYSIVRGFSTQDHMFRFFVVTIGLITALVLGYIKFIPQSQKKK